MHVAASMAEHRAILEAMKQRDADKAAHLMFKHLENAEAAILQLVSPDDENPGSDDG